LTGRCCVLQCAAMSCSMSQCVPVCHSVAVCCSASQWVAVRCFVLQCVAVYCLCNVDRLTRHVNRWSRSTLQHTSTHYTTLQHTATHCNTLQYIFVCKHTATHMCMCRPDRPTCHVKIVNILQKQHTTTDWNTLQLTAAHYKPLPHTVSHCNSLQQPDRTA